MMQGYVKQQIKTSHAAKVTSFLFWYSNNDEMFALMFLYFHWPVK